MRSTDGRGAGCELRAAAATDTFSAADSDASSSGRRPHPCEPVVTRPSGGWMAQLISGHGATGPLPGACRPTRRKLRG